MAITQVSITLGDNTYPLALVNGVWTGTFPAQGVEIGEIYAKLSAVNTTGYTTNEYKLVTVLPEQTPPNVNIISPVDGSWNANLRQPIQFNLTDNEGGSGVNLDSLSINIDGQIISNAGLSYSAIANGYSCTYTPLTDLLEGSHTASITVSDYAGNTSQPDEVQFNIDVNAPNLTVISPVDNLYTNQNSVIVKGIAIDYGVGLASVAVNGEQVETLEDGSFSVSVDIIEGSNIIEVSATDKLDKTVTIRRTVIVDTTPPEIQSVSIQPNMDGVPFWGEFIITVVLKPQTNAAPEFVTGICNGQEMVFNGADNVWKAVVKRAESYSLQITAHDEAGNQTSKDVFFDNGFMLRWDWTNKDYFNFYDENRIEFVSYYLYRWLTEQGYLIENTSKYDWQDVDEPNREQIDNMKRNVDVLKFANFKDWREIQYLNILIPEQLNAIEWDLRLIDLYAWLGEQHQIYSDMIYSGMV